MWDLSSPTGTEPMPPALEGQVLTPGPQGKLQTCILYIRWQQHRVLYLWLSSLSEYLFTCGSIYMLWALPPLCKSQDYLLPPLTSPLRSICMRLIQNWAPWGNQLYAELPVLLSEISQCFQDWPLAAASVAVSFWALRVLPVSSDCFCNGLGHCSWKLSLQAPTLPILVGAPQYSFV